MMDAVRTIRPPCQDRSRATLARLLRTAREMLAEADWHELAITALCERADSSVGSFYARFKGKDALLDSLADEARLELNEVAAWCEEDAARRGLPPASRLRQLTAALARYAERQAGVLRALANEGRPLPWQEPAMHRALAAMLVDGPTPWKTREQALAVLLAACAARATGTGGPGPADPDALARMLARFLAAPE